MASWDRQDGETKITFYYFTLYRDLGPTRTIDQVAPLAGVTSTRLRKLSYKGNWLERTDQWDAHVENCYLDGLIDEAKRNGKRRAHVLTDLMEKAAFALQEYEPGPGTRLSEIAGALRVAVEGLRIEEALASGKGLDALRHGNGLVVEEEGTIKTYICVDEARV